MIVRPVSTTATCPDLYFINSGRCAASDGVFDLACHFGMTEGTGSVKSPGI